MPNTHPANITILQVATDHIQEYAKYTIQANWLYAKKHSYNYMWMDQVPTDRHPTWGKVYYAKHWIANTDWLFVLDADAMVYNTDITLNQFCNDNYTLKMCRNEGNGGDLLNAGAFIIKNNTIAKQMLQIWYDAKGYHDKMWNYWHEQSVINGLYQNHDLFKSNIVEYPSQAFNSYWLDMELDNIDKNQFVQHVMARPNEQKQLIIAELYESIYGKWKDCNITPGLQPLN